MSNQKASTAEPTSLQQTPQEMMQQRFIQLSDNAKSPIRQVISQTEEVVLNAISESIKSLVIVENDRNQLNVEVLRLRKLCEDNKIDWKPTPTVKPKTAPKQS